LSIYPYILNGEIQYYEYLNPYDTHAQHRFEPSEVAYNHGYHPANDWRGTSILYAAMKSINIDDNLEDFLLDFFANNARPGIIFTAQDEPTQRNVELWQRLRDKLENKFTGRGNQFRSMTMPIPATVTELEQPDLQKQFVISDGIRKKILTAFGIPPVLVGDTTNTTFRNAPDARKVFIQQHLRDRMNMIANYITRELLPFFYPGHDHRFAFEWSTFDVMSDGDMLRVDSVNKQLSHGIISLAEAQSQLGQNADPDFENIYMVNGKPASKELLLELANNPLQFLAPQAYTSPRGLEGQAH
jgi:Phage-related protein